MGSVWVKWPPSHLTYCAGRRRLQGQSPRRLHYRGSRESTEPGTFSVAQRFIAFKTIYFCCGLWKSEIRIQDSVTLRLA